MTQILVFFLAFLPAGLADTPPCHRALRAVIDMGSGTTKLTVVEIETCGDSKRIVTPAADSATEALPLEGSKDKAGRIPEAMQERAIAVLVKFKKRAQEKAKALNLKKVDLAVVATHAFRTARNQDSFRRRLRKAGFSVKALSHADEARAGRHAVESTHRPKECEGKSVVVWDIGGGSMQIVSQSKTIALSLGAEKFKQMLKKELRSRPASACQLGASSPNPIGHANITPARQIARKEALRLIGTKPLPGLASACVIGIGGVHNKAIEAQLAKNWPELRACVCGKKSNCDDPHEHYSKTELECLAKSFSEKSDCDPTIEGPYSSTSVSNLFLVLGFMDHLKVNSVFTRDLNMGHALALDPSLEFTEMTVD